MNEIASWWDIAKNVGAGGFFVSGPVAWIIWQAYQIEIKYSKTRDMETLKVLSALTDSTKELVSHDERKENIILNAINEVKNIIISHNYKYENRREQ